MNASTSTTAARSHIAQRRRISRRRAGLILSLSVAGSYAAGMNQSGDHGSNSNPAGTDALFLIMPQGERESVMRSTGDRITLPCEVVWRPVCGSEPGSLTRDRLQAIANTRLERIAELEKIAGGGQAHDGGLAGGSFDLDFEVDGSVPGPALVALIDAEAYFESLFDDPVTVKVNISFDSLEDGVLGSTGTWYTRISWSSSRNSLEDNMDGSDSLQDDLPSGSRIPVRYSGSSETVTNESRVYWTVANYRAAVGSISGVAGDIVFNDAVLWDYNPANGVTGFSFLDVLIHEVGHALGFASGADYRTKDMEALDIFRFQRTDDGHDYNPDSRSEFTARSRLVSRNRPDDQHVCDIVSAEYRMSDGNPYQASHFREQSSNIGLMDPALAAGDTYEPDFFSSADLKMLDAIGWDR